jgi:hypothetical protein
MKKHVFLLVLITLLFSLSSAVAQSKYRKKHEPQYGLGIKGGVNYSGQSTPGGSDIVDVENIIRMNAGVYYNYFFTDNFAIQPELMVSGKGVHWKDQFFNANDILTYIDIPILIKYQPVSLFNVHAGPEFGYLISATQKNIDNSQKTDIKDYYKKYDMGVAVGIEVNLPFRVNLTMRYVLGLISATTDSQYDQPWKNNFFQISAGYRILGK